LLERAFGQGAGCRRLEAMFVFPRTASHHLLARSLAGRSRGSCTLERVPEPAPPAHQQNTMRRSRENKELTRSAFVPSSHARTHLTCSALSAPHAFLSRRPCGLSELHFAARMMNGKEAARNVFHTISITLLHLFVHSQGCSETTALD